MQSLVVRYTKDISFHQAVTVGVPLEYKSVEDFLMDYCAWCLHTNNSELGFLGLGLQPSHGDTLEVLTLEEWFWKYKKTIAP